MVRVSARFELARVRVIGSRLYFELGLPVVLYPALELLFNVKAWWNEKQIYSKTINGPAVISHSCCGVPANVLSVCLFVCLFVFLAKLFKKIIKIK